MDNKTVRKTEINLQFMSTHLKTWLQRNKILYGCRNNIIWKQVDRICSSFTIQL